MYQLGSLNLLYDKGRGNHPEHWSAATEPSSPPSSDPKLGPFSTYGANGGTIPKIV